MIINKVKGTNNLTPVISITFLTLLLLFLAVNNTYSQDDESNESDIPKNAISFNLLGTTPILGINYERLLSEKVSVEIGLGIPSVGAGIKYYPYAVKKGKARLHIGFTTVLIRSGDNEITGFMGSLFFCR